MGILIMVHSLWRWLVLLGAGAAIAGAVLARRGETPAWAARAGLVYMIAIDLQVLIGLILWSAGGGYAGNAYYAYIHPLAMIAALAAAHIGRRRERQALATGQGGGAALLAYLASLVILLAGIPWWA